jgi:predicted nucleotidyltransferase
MSVGHVNHELASRLPLERIAEICQRYGVSELSVYGPILEGDIEQDVEVQFLVMFLGDDFGPWGSKLDLLENDLSGALHRKVSVASRRGVEQSTPSPWREQILGARRLIYEP